MAVVILAVPDNQAAIALNGRELANGGRSLPADNSEKYKLGCDGERSSAGTSFVLVLCD